MDFYWKPIANNINKLHLEIISVEHLETKQVYGVLRLKHHIKIKYGIVMIIKRLEDTNKFYVYLQ